MKSLAFQPDRLYFVPLGGCGEIGMNLNVYAFGGKLLVVDVGVTFENEPGIQVVMADVSWLKKHRKDIVGIIITHGHEDHVGAVGHLWRQLQAPIYATPFTAGLVDHKLREARVKAPVHRIEKDGHADLGPFSVGFIRLTHSIPEPSGLAIRTEAGTVVHTGDWKLDPSPVIGEAVNEDALKALGKAGVLAVVCDSTCVFEDGWSGSEQEVQDFLVKHIPSYTKGRVVMACFASNVARLKSCYVAAQAAGRRVVLAGRSLERIDGVARNTGYFDDIPPFLKDMEGSKIPAEKTMIIATGSQGEERAALVRMAQGTHPKIKLEAGDHVLFSSRVIPGNEKAIFAVQNILVSRGIRVVTPKMHPDMHVSGHPYRDELIQMYDWLKPKIVIPVHGEVRHLHAHAALAKKKKMASIVPENGDVIVLDKKDGPQKMGRVTVGRLGLDGTKLLPMDSPVLTERRRLSDSGLISVALSSGRKGSGVSVHVTSVGVAADKQRTDLTSEVRVLVQQLMEHGAAEKRQDNQALRENVAQEVRRFCQNELGKKPLVLVQTLF